MFAISCTIDPKKASWQVRITTWDEPDNSVAGQITQVLQKEFDQQFPHIKVRRRSKAGRATDYRLAFTTAMASDNGPDCYDAAYFPTIPLWIDQGFCLPLDRYIKDDLQFKNVVEAAFRPAIKNGHLYGVPSELYVMTLFYRKDLFREAGLDPNRPPQNWDEFAKYASRLTDKNKHRYGFVLLGQDWASWHWENWVWQTGGEVTERLPDGKCKIRFTEEPTVRALQFYKDLRWKYRCVQPDPLQNNESNTRDFVQGRAAMMFSAPDWIGTLFNEGLKPEQIGIAPLPAGPTGIRATQLGGAFYIINPRSSKRRQDAAWQYIKFMTSKETQIKRLKLLEEANLRYPLASFYKDLKINNYITVSEEWGAASTTSIRFGRMEYFLKDRIEPYLARPIQAILIDERTDPKTELAKCAQRVQREVVDPYNQQQVLRP